ncbi:hypothetical protein [Cochlodiniinecator piscidefendens]|uniref:hypothetical protein n=1 Tax=Cochlodiniinecator piscidefendens TaxID=2715756 RepID=UPI0014072DBB|nr:hypothetical protein [Cochlodiniinecator piscidefendens]
MGEYFIFIVAVVIATFWIALSLGLRYSQASLLFGIVALALAPIAMHRISSQNWAIGTICGLGIFASFPMKRLFQLDGPLQEVPVSLLYIAILWVISMPWKKAT